jgi:hypothetical protein
MMHELQGVLHMAWLPAANWRGCWPRFSTNYSTKHLASRVPPYAHPQLTESSRDSSKHYTRATLHQATLKLTDFGRAVPFKQLAAQQGSLDAETPAAQPPWGKTICMNASDGGEVGTRHAVNYNADGAVVMADPTLRPPEVI